MDMDMHEDEVIVLRRSQWTKTLEEIDNLKSNWEEVLVEIDNLELDLAKKDKDLIEAEKEVYELKKWHRHEVKKNISHIEKIRELEKEKKESLQETERIRRSTANLHAAYVHSNNEANFWKRQLEEEKKLHESTRLSGNQIRRDLEWEKLYSRNQREILEKQANDLNNKNRELIRKNSSLQLLRGKNADLGAARMKAEDEVKELKIAKERLEDQVVDDRKEWSKLCQRKEEKYQDQLGANRILETEIKDLKKASDELAAELKNMESERIDLSIQLALAERQVPFLTEALRYKKKAEETHGILERARDQVSRIQKFFYVHSVRDNLRELEEILAGKKE